LLTLFEFLLLYVYGGDDYFVNLKVVSKTTKCRDFTVISPVFVQKCTVILQIFYRDFLTALSICEQTDRQTETLIAISPLPCKRRTNAQIPSHTYILYFSKPG